MQHQSWPEHLGRRLAGFFIDHRFIVMAFSVLVCVGVSYGASTLRFAGDYRVFFGNDNPDFQASEAARDTFGSTDNLAFLVVPKDGDIYQPTTVAAVQALTDAAWNLQYVSRVDSLTNFQNTVGEEGQLIVDDLIPPGLFLTQQERLAIEEIARAEPLIDGFVASRDSAATIVNVVLQPDTSVASVTSKIAAQARSIRDQVMAEHPGVEVRLLGVVMLSASFEEAGLRDSSTMIPLVYLLILIVMVAVLRSLSAMAAGLAVIGLSTLFGMGVGGFIGVALTPISLTAPTIILTIAVADSIHILASVRGFIRKGMEKRQAVIEATATNFTPIAITSLTTIIGFLTLNFSDSPPFHHLGNISAAGIFAAWVLSITFLPAMLASVPLKFDLAQRFLPTKEAPENNPVGVLARYSEALIARPRAFLFGSVAVGLALTALIPLITINDQWTKYFSQQLEFRRAVDRAEPYFGAENIDLVLNSGRPDGVNDPVFMRDVEAFTAWLRTQDDVATHVYSISDIMKRVNRSLHADDPAFYTIPEDAPLIAQYLLVYELSLPYGLNLTDRISADKSQTRISVTTEDISTRATKDFLTASENWFAENASSASFSLTTTGSKKLFAFVADRNIQAMFEGALYLVVAVFLILSITFRSLGIGLISLLPNALPILATFGVWALLVGVVGFSVAAVSAVAVGLVVDFSVHFLAKYLRARRVLDYGAEQAVRYAIETAGTAILATTIILAVGFAFLATSTFKANADLGLLTAIAVVFAMIANFTLLPAVLLLRSPIKNTVAVPATA